MVLSVEQDNSPEFAAIMELLFLGISDIPFNGPIGGIILGLVDGEVIINPNQEQREKSKMHVTLSADKEKIVMIEAGANEVPDEVMLDAIKKGHDEIKKIVEFIEGIVKEIGKPKFEYISAAATRHFDKVSSLCKDELAQAMMNDDKKNAIKM